MNGWKCRHLDYLFAFTKSHGVTDAFLNTGFHVQDSYGNDMPDRFYLKLLKNFYGSRCAATNWFTVLTNRLEERGFSQSQIDSFLFTRHDCIIIRHFDDYLIFYKKKEVLIELIKSL